MDCPPLNLEVKNLEEFFKGIAEFFLSGIGGVVLSFKELINNILNIPLSESDVVASAVTSAGVSLTSLFLCMEFFSQITSKWFERMEDAIQLGIKLVVAKIIIENSSSIVGGISSYFKNLGQASIADGFDTVAGSLTSMGIPDKGGPFGLGYILVAFLLLIILLVVVILLMMMTIDVLGIVFEIGIHMAVGPIALSTLCNSTFRSTGLSYIKSLSAVCLQTTVIGAICKVYTKYATFFNLNLDGSLATGGGGFGFVFGCFAPLLSLLVLCVTIKKSSDITKRMFGA